MHHRCTKWGNHRTRCPW